MHIPPLISDLALILGVAGYVAIVFRWLNQPIVLGYLLAGILVGPHVTLIPTVTDTENLKIWAELGVIFLLFVLGLEFSFRKLFRVGTAALVAASLEVLVMVCLGYGVGRLIGWGSMDSVFLGGALAISSTTIIIKAFEEQGVKTQSFASLVLGILIIEDLFAILLLAFLATIGASHSLEGLSLFKQVGILVGVLAATIPLGLWITPRFLKIIRWQLNDETRVIVSLALCLLLVLASTFAGFSPALGAFLMGAFMGETAEGERIERFLKPIRDLFGAVFFTSVGMLVDISSIIHNLPIIALVSVVTVAGKILSTASGARLAGQDMRTALQAGLSLGQIGEFSFIIATLGLTLNVVRPELYPLTVSVSLVTTFLTPYLIRFAVSPKFMKGVEFNGGKGKSPRFKDWDSHLVELEVHPHFVEVGKSLQGLNLKQRFGVFVVSIARGERKIVAPTRDEILMPYDRILTLGTDEQLAVFEKHLKSKRHDVGESSDASFALEKVVLSGKHPFIGMKLKDGGIREKIHGIVIGVERGRDKIMNPEANLILQQNDTVWVYGREDLLRSVHAN